MLQNFRRKRHLLGYLNAIEKLNRRFSGLALLLKAPLQVETIEKDYSRLVKAIFYCQMKVRKSYNVDFIPLLLSKLQNKIYSSRQHLVTAFVQELKLLRNNSNRNVTHLFVLVKKFVRLEAIANEFLKEFGAVAGTNSFFFEQDVHLLRNSIEHVKKVQSTLMDPETENYILNIKRKIQGKKA